MQNKNLCPSSKCHTLLKVLLLRSQTFGISFQQVWLGLGLSSFGIGRTTTTMFLWHNWIGARYIIHEHFGFVLDACNISKKITEKLALFHSQKKVLLKDSHSPEVGSNPRLCAFFDRAFSILFIPFCLPVYLENRASLLHILFCF